MKPHAVLLALLVLACSGGGGAERAGPWSPVDEDLDNRWGVRGAEGPQGGAAGASSWASAGSAACVDGEERECLVHHRLANGVPTCWEGVRVCVAGRWGPCEAPSTQDSTKEMPETWTVIELER